MTNTPLFWIMLLFFVADWVAVGSSIRDRQGKELWVRSRWITKPGALILLLAWFTQMGGWQGFSAWFGAGLVFSLFGDVLLMLPTRFFIAGMAAFFTAHVLYIIGFNQPALGLTAALFILPATGKSMLHNVREENILLPVIAYTIVILSMGISAALTLTRADWNVTAAVMATLGALLFILSDSILAIERFAHPSTILRTLVMVCYHLGQLGIAAGVLWQIMP